MRIAIEHDLLFEYDAYISESFMELRVEPLTDDQQTLRSFYLAVGPPARARRYVDWNGNAVHQFGIGDFHDRIEVVARSVVETRPPPIGLEAADAPPLALEALGRWIEFVGFGGPVARSPALERLAAGLAAPASDPVGRQIEALGALLRERFEYRTDVTDYRSTSDHILEEGAGVCQDFAHLALALLRLREIPCRYVGGYLHVEREEREPSQAHAWIEVGTHDGRWVAFDPTHDRVPGEHYVAVARGRHYDDIPPNRGIFRGNARETLRAEVHTSPAEDAGVAGLHREIGRIDVPVFHEIPRTARRTALQEQGGAADQQQQQQQ